MKVIEINHTDFDIDVFLKKHWQKTPVLIRGMFPTNLSPIKANELAGLACEDGIESRIVQEVTNEGISSWNPINGPFDENAFNELPEQNWSLLVQSVDHWHTDVSYLLESFQFLPRHILDDVMVSFAPKGGNVGPHFDYYDVFLIQGEGSRLWKIGQECDDNTPASSSSKLLILDNFQETEAFTLNTGDVLYLPPMLAHWGIALEDCITYSIGFRTPSLSQSIIAFTDALTDSIHEETRINFNDRNKPHVINENTISNLKAQLQSALLDENKLLNWYGQFSTESKNENTVVALDNRIASKDIVSKIQQDYLLLKNEGSRFLYQDNPQYKLFIDGESYNIGNEDVDFLDWLCINSAYNKNEALIFLKRDNLVNIITDMVNRGSLYLTK